MEPRRDFQFNPFSSSPSLDDLPDDIDWSNPQSFLRAMGGPMPKTPSAAEARREANEKLREVFAGYRLLSKIIHRHEATIRKRWTKKTRQQRLQILLKAWPGMPASHRPDFEAFRKESKEERESGTRYRDAFLWPSINQEDLSQTRLLPLLLNARGRHPPPAFAAADNDAAHLGRVTKAITPVFLNNHVMVLNGVTTANEYGKLVSWDSHPDAFEWMHTRKQFLPGEGLVILEIQARLMTFLVDCCHEILHDIPPSALISDAFPLQPEPPHKPDNDASGFASLAIMAAEAPYRLPANLDLGRLESLLAAKTSAAEDHVWALREDPAYFAQELLETKDHRQEMLSDTKGRPHPSTNTLRSNTFWTLIIGSTVADAYLSLEFFAELHRQAKDLRVLQKKYRSWISPSKDLPKDYLVALLRFRHMLNEVAKGPLSQLKLAAVASPPMRKFFVRDPPIDAHSTKISIRSRGIEMTSVEEHLIWLLRTLWEDDYTLFLTRLAPIVDELEYLLQTEPQADALISAHVAKIIGDLSIVAQCSRQLELYLPWAQSFEMASVEYSKQFKNEHAERSKPWTQLLATFGGQNLSSAADLGEPSPGKFTYPYHKRRTKETVDALRRAESILDLFWAKVDGVTSAKVNLEGTALQLLLSQPRILRRTAEWVEPSSTDKKVESVLNSDPNALDLPLSNLFIGHSPEGPSLSRPEPKAKVKTKGQPAVALTGHEPPTESQPNPHDPQPTFPVDARALKVFRTLFFNPEVTSTPGSVSWNDFLHAMFSMGFQIEKLYGSVWQFSPTKLDVERSIHFHEPHPTGKIPLEVARRHGRRLTRAYGWFGGMFILKKK